MIRTKSLFLALFLTALASQAFPNSRDFADTTADYLDKASTCGSITAAPASLGIWFNADDATASDDLMSLGDGSNASLNILSLRSNSATGLLVARGADGTAATDATTSAAHTTATWETGLAVFSAANARAVYLNGANKGTAVTTRTPTGIDNTVIGTDQLHAANSFDGRMAHASIWNKALSDLEAGYFGTGGNPRAISGLTCYYKITAASPEVDELGGGSLTVHGTTSSGSNPTVASWFTGTSYSNQTWTQNSAISSLTVDARFDDVSSAFTTSWKVLGTAASDTTASGAGTSSAELTVASATNLVAGDYIKIAAGGSPTLVLYKSGSTLLLATARTWSNSDTVYEFPVNSASITGVSLSAGSLSGTPTGTQAQTDNYFLRATNNATASLIADSNLFSITINSSAPSFSVTPTVTGQTATVYTLSATPSTSATWYAVAYKSTLSAPTCTQIKAAQDQTGAAAIAANNKAVTGADTLTVTISGTARPIHNIASCLNNAGGDSSVSTLTNQALNAPSGKQDTALTSISATSVCQAINNVSTPDIAASDVFESDLLTTPGANAITMQTDCNQNLPSDGSRQYLCYRDYDADVGDWMSGGGGLCGAGYGTQWFNNQTPAGDDLNLVLRVGDAFSLDLCGTFVDAEGDTLTGSNSSTGTGTGVDKRPAGTAISNCTWSDTGAGPTTEGSGSFTFTATDIAAAPGSITVNWQVIDDSTVPDCQTAHIELASCIALLTDELLDYTTSTASSATVAAGSIISQSPAPLSVVDPFSAVALVVSSGNLSLVSGHGISGHGVSSGGISGSGISGPTISRGALGSTTGSTADSTLLTADSTLVTADTQ